MLTRVRTLEEIKDQVGSLMVPDDPKRVLREAGKELSKFKEGSEQAVDVNNDLFKSMTLFEFDNGTLLTTIIPEQYKTFGINLMRDLQLEYNCQTPSEKVTSELVAINYIRTLEIERKISNLTSHSLSQIEINYLGVLSKELDRANRHYLNSLQLLRSFKQLPLHFTLKANTAVIGQNQLVQTNG